MGDAKLRLRFDPDQDYQLDAIRAVTDLFDGYARRDTSFRLRSEDVGREDIVANVPADYAFSEGWLAGNLGTIQQRNTIVLDGPPVLEQDGGSTMDVGAPGSWRYPSFTIEMETGTGKTYVYLRTIYELRRLYGFSKFVIVVPSIAIYEGVVKSFAIMRDHFASLYDNEPVNLIRYDGAQLSKLRAFATSATTDVLVITLDAFNKATNTLYKASEKLPGERRPFQFIQETRPILILDEPQNMESEIAKRALRTLHPLFALRYSATHRSSPNLIYRLTPFEAYRRGLVKRIEVVGVTELGDLNAPFLALESIAATGPIRATVNTYALEDGRTREATVTLRDGDDLHAKTKRDEHKGYRVREIHRGERYVLFENGIRLDAGAQVAPSRPAIFKAQIEETVRQHMERQEELKSRGIKVLSLFFVDRVANYAAADGIVRRLFDEAFRKHRVAFDDFRQIEPEQAREAYFARARTNGGEEVEIDTEGRASEREAERRAFELIMKKKEQLLSLEEPVAFIFAHSALKEGWDNPNVFQICTLNQTVSEPKKRQEIGRGLRLCVDQSGDRVSGEEVNVLTVVANERYQTYVSELQAEYVRDGEAPPPAPTKAGEHTAHRNDALYLGNDDFELFWAKLRQRIRYRINIETDALVDECVAEISKQPFPDPRVVIQRGGFVTHTYKLELRSARRDRARIEVTITDTRNQTTTSSRDFGLKDNLAVALNDEQLRNFVLSEVEDGKPARAIFENGVELTLGGRPFEFSASAGRVVSETAVPVASARYPVFNIVDRAARDTRLTRATIRAIFGRLDIRLKRRLIANPEGFAGVFIPKVREVVANHVARALEFELQGGLESLDLEELFPPTRRYPQKETIRANACGLYDLVQKDSKVEEAFVARLNSDPQVVLYFKFPPAFKVSLPRIIGNYNPDWGIIRRSESGTLTFHLVRETKGSEDFTKLQFPHEQRKIVSAEKYFAAAGIDYRAISEKTTEWWTRPRQAPQ